MWWLEENSYKVAKSREYAFIVTGPRFHRHSVEPSIWLSESNKVLGQFTRRIVRNKTCFLFLFLQLGKGYARHGTRHLLWRTLGGWPVIEESPLLDLTHLFPRTFSQLFKEKYISEVVRNGSIIIFRLSKLWKAKFFILCGVIFLVRVQWEIWNSMASRSEFQCQTILNTKYHMFYTEGTFTPSKGNRGLENE